MTIAITGASGQLGRIAIENLKTRVAPEGIVALARSPEKVQDLGVTARAFDYRKPAELAAALAGVEVLGLISSSDFDDRPGQHGAVIAAAKEAGVRRIVYTSILRADSSPMVVAVDHKVTEAAIKQSGLAYTMLRNGWYTENWTGAIPGALAGGAYIGCAGTAQVAPATRQDYGEALAAVLAGDGHENQTYELAGAPFTLAELAAEISAQTGQALPYNNLPQEAYQEILSGFGLPEGLSLMIADADAQAAEGWLFDDSGDLDRLIGRPATPMAAAVAAMLASLPAQAEAS